MKNKRKILENRIVKSVMGQDCYRFNGKSFVRIRNSRNLQMNDILRMNSRYYMISRNGLKEINERKASKLIHGASHKSELKILKNTGEEKNGAEINEQTETEKIESKAKSFLENLIMKDVRFRKSRGYLIISNGNENGCRIDLESGDVFTEDRRRVWIWGLENHYLSFHYQIIVKALTIAYKPTQIWQPTVKKIPVDEEGVRKANELARQLLEKVIESTARLEKVNDHVKIYSINNQVYYIDLATAKVYNKWGKYCCSHTKGFIRVPTADLIISKALTIAFKPSMIYTI